MNASLYRCVLSDDLNISRLSADLMYLGRLFHSVGTATVKDLAAKVLVFVLGITSKSSLADLSPDLLGVQNLIRHFK